jgi:Concanavalin A-like lectin/glucanases superfamily
VTTIPRPVLHARDHMPGGADPIPGLDPSPGINAWVPAGGYSGQILAESSLVSYWRMNDTGSTMLDLNENFPPYHASVINASGSSVQTGAPQPPVIQDPGARSVFFPHDGCVRGFAGADTYNRRVTTNRSGLPQDGRWNFTDAGGFTLECWLWANAPFNASPPSVHDSGVSDGFGPIVSQYISGGPGDASNVGGWELRMQYDQATYGDGIGAVAFVCRRRDSPGGMTSVASPVAVVSDSEAWLFVAATYDAGLVSLYLNGSLAAASGGATIEGHPSDTVMGGGTYGVNHDLFTYYGNVSEVAIFNEALDEQTIRRHMNGVGGADEPGRWVPVDIADVTGPPSLLWEDV